MNRLNLLMLVSVMLYAGPVIAGLAGFGWGVVPAFVVIFLAWNVVMRPAQWPRDPAAWREPAVQTGAALQVVVLAVVVLVCFGAGRGIGGVVGYLPPLPLVVPLFLSLAAVPLARLIHDPRQAAGMDTLLDDAIHRLKSFDKDVAFPSADARHILDGTRLALRLLQPVQDLPADTTPGVIGQHLAAIATQVDDARLREALVERAEGHGPSRPLLTALALHATDGRRMEMLGLDTVDPAFAALPHDVDVMALYARRAVAAVAEDEDVRAALPRPHLVEQALSGMTGTAAEGPLRALLDQSRLRVEPTL
ncbi:MAG: hypothetical protein ACT4OK_22050 [Gemmobacter sp.]